MSRSLLVLPFVFALAACGGATNTDDGAEDRTASASTCTLAAGEDACTRFPALTPAARSALAEATAFAGETRALVVSLERACRGVLEALDQPAPAEAPAAKPHARARTSCDRALAALAALRPAGAALELQRATCRQADVPACVLGPKREAWQACDAPTIVVKLPPPQSVESRRWVDVVERRTPPIFATLDVVRVLSERTKRLALAIPTADLGDCGAATSALMSDAIVEIQTATAIASASADVLAE